MAVPLFDGHVVPAHVDAESAEELEPAERSALDAFLTLTPNDRRAASRHVAAYARDVWASRGSLRALWPGDVWKSVSPGAVFLMERDGICFVAMEAECSWEPEHGLLLVWREGRTLCKVGPFDGHATNTAAYADPAMDDVVYKSLTGRFDTSA